jgi:hypothetical protein
MSCELAHELQEQHLVEFVVPSGGKGQDFDLEARLDDQKLLAIEVKCLMDEPDYNSKLLYSRPKKASSQLPQSGHAALRLD